MRAEEQKGQNIFGLGFQKLLLEGQLVPQEGSAQEGQQVTVVLGSFLSRFLHTKVEQGCPSHAVVSKAIGWKLSVPTLLVLVACQAA